MANPAFGVIVNAVVLPSITVADVGAIEPPAPALVLTRWVTGGVESNVAFTVQFAVITPVVYVAPLRLPPQPVTVSMKKLLFAVTVKVVVSPSTTVRLPGAMLPFAPAVPVTVCVVVLVNPL